jgi:hypothetical protein
MVDILQIRIQNTKTKVIRTIPLKLWENGIKSDLEWVIYNGPKPKAVAEKPVVVELKKPVPPPAVAARVAARVKAAKHKRK